MKRIGLLFRKPVEFFSIERVFGQLQPELNRSVSVKPWIAPYGGISPSGIIKNIMSARACAADLYHITGDIHYLTLGLPRARTVLTIHDCVFLYQYKGYKRLLLKWLLLDLPVRRSALITTISDSTRKDILKYTGCRPEKIVVIPDPVNDIIRFEARPFTPSAPVILFVGTTANKNLARVIPALEDISCSLVIIGVLPPEMLSLLKKTNIRYSNQSGLSDKEIADKYVEADIVLFPSTFEGFGLPIVEAQKAGRPVITSDLAPMREVAGDGACLVNPFSVSSIRQGVLRVTGDSEYREDLIRKGFRNVTRFDAKRIADQYLSCYRKLLPDL